MDNLSVQLHKQAIACSLGTTAVNHLVYADDLHMFAPSAKQLQTLLNTCYAYGCDHDVQYNAGKSLVVYFDSRNANLAREMALIGKKFNITTFYLGHVICNDLSDEADMQFPLYRTLQLATCIIHRNCSINGS